jgi:hypothetical protein
LYLDKERGIDHSYNTLQSIATKNMADEMVIDGDESRDQIYTAVDMGDDGSGDEIYIVSIGAPLVLSSQD